MSNGVNGYLQRLDEPAARWAEDLRSILDGSHSYEEQCLRAYQYYEQELSWERAIARFTDLASEFLKKGK
jgi:glycosyltransferase involved in cell wall biosynthesis